MTDLKQAAGGDSRASRFAALCDAQPEVLVIGGGINGISTYRELALQGVRVALVERGDWCEAASGALSRMVHGGLRYMETGEFGLVRESVLERDRLLKNAPHYVRPLPTTVPIDSYTSGLIPALQRFLRLTEKPARRGAAIIKIGLSFYDFFTRRQGTMPRHRLDSGKATRARWPGFNDWVKCSATYYDAWISQPERLGLELVKDIAAQCPQAHALNYVQAEQAEGGRIRLLDRVSGAEGQVAPRVVINATGAWIDQTNARLAGPQAPRMVGGTKGSHLIIRHERLLRELGDHMVYYENQEGRVCILFPYFGNVLVGSTDLRTDTPDTVRCEEDERAYILASLAFVFPDLGIRNEDILYTFSGVRPLPHSDAAVNGRISRNHSCVHLPADAAQGRPFDVISLVGGKWTTFRAFGEQAADRALALLGQRRQVSTADLPIGGGRDYPAEPQREGWLAALVQRHGLTPERARTLLSRYGSAAEAVAAFIAAGPDQTLAGAPEYSERELRYLIRHEDVEQLDDLLVRRTPLAISGELGPQAARAALAVLADERGWDGTQRAAAWQATVARLQSAHGLSVVADSLAAATQDELEPAGSAT